MLELTFAGGAAEEVFFLFLTFLRLFIFLPCPTPGVWEGCVWMALPDLRGKKIFEAVPNRIFPVAVAFALEIEFPFVAVPKRSFKSSRVSECERDTVPKPVVEAPELAAFCPWSWRRIPKPLFCTPRPPAS